VKNEDSPNQEDKLVTCVENYLKEFDDYDYAVTAVASWKAILSLSNYKNKVTFFDWFPLLKSSSGNDQTPDFAVLFKNQYGIIGEVKAGFPQDDKAFEKELKQLIRYDDVTSMSNSKGEQVEVKKKDIILLIREFYSADEVAKRIFEKINDPKSPFKLNKSNLIVMSYRFDNERGKTFFVMRRNTHQDNGSFQEPELQKHIVEKMNPLPVPPKLFKNHKTQYYMIPGQDG